MSRYFNGQEVELLAPSGNFEIFKEVLYSNADAFYFGGKSFNMRMHRKDFNFTNDEIVEALNIAHRLNKKVYITVNNLYSNEELDNVVEYLRFLESIQPDALIIQDMCILMIINNLNLKLNLHSSVMMNVHNLEMIKYLRTLGVSRIVCPRTSSLQNIKSLSNQTDMEFEYFIHGDMCIASDAGCYYSGVIFGKSGNRGLCLKPCRWGLKLKKDNLIYDTEYPLAAKDMSMYEHIPELIEAGIISFKIEGRMRDAQYIKSIVNIYGDAIDRYIDDPLNYNRSKEYNQLYETRKRDFTTAYSFGNPKLNYINTRYEGTGKLYSTGKVFSTPTEAPELNLERVQQIKCKINELPKKPSNKIKLTVKVNNFFCAMEAFKQNVHAVYLSGDVFEPDNPFSKYEINELNSSKGVSKLYYSLPRMMSDGDFARFNHYINTNNLNIDGIVCTDLGAIKRYNNLGISLIGDYSLNVYNLLTDEFYKNCGVTYNTLSIESTLLNTLKTINCNTPIELIVQGSPTVMLLDFDLYENINNTKAGLLYLLDENGLQRPVYRDSYKRNHVYMEKEICLLPILRELESIGLSYARICGCHYTPEQLKTVLNTYTEFLSGTITEDKALQNINFKKQFTLGAFNFD